MSPLTGLESSWLSTYPTVYTVGYMMAPLSWLKGSSRVLN